MRPKQGPNNEADLRKMYAIFGLDENRIERAMEVARNPIASGYETRSVRKTRKSVAPVQLEQPD